MRLCFIVNPAAGSGGFQKLVIEAANHLSQLGCIVERVETTGKGDAIHLAQQAAAQGFDVAVAVGGDGTVNEVCNGLAGTETALGVLPAGTANVYAADVGIPIWWPLNPGAVNNAAEVLVTGQRRRIDLGRLRLGDGAERYFLMWCGIGLDAAISQAIKPGDTRRLGYAAWILSGLMVSFDFMGTRATILTDNGLTKARVLLAVVSNGQLYGRIWRMSPKAKLDDGLLDVGIMTGHGWPSTFRHLAGLTLRQHVRDPDFHLYRTTLLSLSAKEALPVHVDAEPVGTTPVEIEVAPLALSVIVPQKTPHDLFERAPLA
ncbi:MAG: diacylglycerol kinase family lipid kinase [Chloroflexi bacterium]|nr:diacylglycerol kinase family lipid kinase [Chloroflexota bacterium]